MILVPSTANLLLIIKIVVSLYLLYLLGLAVYNRFFHKLRRFPGPFWASITPLWYWHKVRYGHAAVVHYPLHEKYGDFVRIAPNLLAVCNAAAIDTVYRPKNGKVWRKSDFYDGFDPHIPGARTDGFSTRHEGRHNERRRIIAGLYTQGNVLQYEPCVDRVIDVLYSRMEKFCDSQEATDMSVWLKRYTFDVVGEIFYGRKGGFGMIRDDIDYNQWCYLMDVMPPIGSSITYLPYGFRTLYFLTQLFFKSARDGLKGSLDVVEQAKIAVSDQWKLMQVSDDYPKNTMLTHMLEIVRDRGDKIGWSIADCQTEAWAVIWAGSDTTAIALTSIFYHLHKNPDKLSILLEEIDKAFDEGRLKYPIRFNDARKLQYLHAVVMESMRTHSSLGTGLPREVPTEGADVCGTWIPGDSEVIMNPCSVQFDRRAFGADADSWIPERWLRDGEEAAARMERSMLQFGHGPRVCIGRHISETEMYKMLIPLLREFKFELLVDEWKVWGGWFHNPSNVLCRVSKRRPDQPKPELVLEHMK